VVWQQKQNLPTNILLHVVAMRQAAAQGQFATMISDREVLMRQRYINEFIHMEKLHPLILLDTC